jgi:hypothetical protein
MEGKLIKEVDFYGLKIEGKIIGLSNNSTNKLLNYPFKLSLKNCEAIANDYDLDELAILCTKEEDTIVGNQKMAIGFIKGFQKALEILGDKKFSEEDMKKACSLIFLALGDGGDITTDEVIQSLQQTEWDVEIVMRPASLVYKSNLVIEELDADGCLILKRI